MSNKTKDRLSFLVNAAFVAVVVLLVYLSLKYVIGWVLPFLLAFCIVSIVHPVVLMIKKRLKIKQEIVSLIVMVLVYALVAMLIFLLIMQLIVIIQNGFTVLPDYYKSAIEPSLLKAGKSISNFISDLPPGWQEQFITAQGQLIQGLQSALLGLSQQGVSLISRISGRVPAFLITFVFTIMLSFFVSMQYESVVRFLKQQMSPKVKGVISDLRGIVRVTIFKYLKASLTLMAITFVELSFGLLVLRAGNAIPIAAGIAIFDALPFFGTGAILIPWCIIELLQGNYTFALGLIILYGIVYVIRNLIEPKIVGDKLGLNPIVSLTAIYLGFKLFGVLGMIIMPICTQTAMELHKNGTIRLFKETTARPRPDAKEDTDP